MLQNIDVSENAVTQEREPLDDFERFAVEELGAVLVDVGDDQQRYRVDCCWLTSESAVVAETELYPQPAIADPAVPFHQQPAGYLEHLLTVPQLPAPAEVFLLPAVSASTLSEKQAYQRPEVATFEEWLETDLGKEVYRRIMNNLHAVPMDLSAAYFDTSEDVQQKALIWLWEYWQRDPGYQQLAKRATSLSHAAGSITKVAIMRARCMYAKRRREGREKQTDLFYEDGYEKLGVVLQSADVIRSTDVHDHDRTVLGSDKRADIRAAIERVIQRMIAHHSIAKNFRRIPIEHITRTIVEGHMHHYVDRFSQTGNFRQFCEARGVSKNRIARWRPQIFEYLRQELTAYAPA